MDYMMRVMLAAASGGGGGGGSIPTSGLLGWYKADAGVTKDGSNKVSQWDDQSGSGKHLTQATSGQRPTWETAIKNGLPGIRFPGGTGMSFPTFTGIVSMMVVVTYPNSTFVTRSTLISNNFSGGWEMWAGAGGQSWTFIPLSGLYRRNGSARATNETISPLNASHYIVGYKTGSGATITSEVLGNWTDYFNSWVGHVHELAFWNYQLSSPDIATVESYITSRWGAF